MTRIKEFNPDWLVANGDYGGDYRGAGLSDDATFESVQAAIHLIREVFGDRSRFIFGDHDLGKYCTSTREGGIRLGSLERGEKLLGIPSLIEATLALDPVIRELAHRFADKQHALFLGRGAMYPIAMEGALKLKEISYIHAEAYAAGELKHGPLALVDKDMPVIAVAPNNDLVEKLKSNLQEVRARGGELFVFADPESGIESSEGVTVIHMPRHVSYFQAPAVYTIPLQLLAYHCAILKGTDVDQPRNLAKSVTVE